MTADVVDVQEAAPRRTSGRWLRFLAVRVLGGAFAVLGACTLVFVMIAATGNPIRTLLSGAASAAAIDRITAEHGYDQPVIVQYVRFLGDVFTGNFPPSLRLGVSPFGPVLASLGNTLVLGLGAIALGVVVGLGAGYLSVFARSPLVVRAILGVMTTLQAVPSFLLGIVLVLVFGVMVPVLPTSGSGTPAHLLLPTITLAAVIAPALARVFRASLLDTVNADHVVAARAKGIGAGTLRRRHIVGNALPPAVALIGVQSGALLAGAILVESVFAWPGLGSLTVDAVTNQDYSLVVACVLVIAVTFVLCTTIADIVVALLNPHLQRSGR